MPETPPPELNPIAQLRRLERRLPELSTLQLLQLRDAAEACLARAPLTAAEVSSMVAATE